MNSVLALSRIEAIVAELEQLDSDTGGHFRQPSDLEAGQIVRRIERKMLSEKNNGIVRFRA